MSTPNDTLRARLDEAVFLSLNGGTRMEVVRTIRAALRILDEADREDEAGTPSARGTYAVVPDPGGRAAPPPTTPEDASESAGSSSTTSRITHE